MTTRQERTAQFSVGPPPAHEEFELLCEDHAGTYVLPFPCRRADDAWRNARTGETLQVEALGWRRWGWIGTAA